MKILISASFLLVSLFLAAQPETYTVEMAGFSKTGYDEISPAYYGNGVVFSANRGRGLFRYSSSGNNNLFSLFYADTTGGGKNKGVHLFSKELTTKLNDGPATFNSAGDYIIFSRNLEVEGKLKELSHSRNKLGLFSSFLEEGKWDSITEFEYNSKWDNLRYNITSPSLTPDGSRLFFASDMPGGYGGSDIYYSDLKNGIWSNPVNLGPLINTAGNEAYPYINALGELFFSSDGHPGMGGRDIFVSTYNGVFWSPPVGLDPPINSRYDDLGIIMDSLMTEGYFSSNRSSSFDIYHFQTNEPQIFYRDLQQENQYCFQFQDTGTIKVDTLTLQYRWNFGDGIKAPGGIANHCFPGAGKYNVKLDLVERGSNNHFFTLLEYALELKDIEQAYIQSSDYAITGAAVAFTAENTNLPGNQILEYYWDFGNGVRPTGSNVNHTFNEEGDFMIILGLTLKSATTGEIRKTGVSKIVKVFKSQGELEWHENQMSKVQTAYSDIKNYRNASLKSLFSVENAASTDAVYIVEIMSSGEKISLNHPTFKRLPPKYTLREKFDSTNHVYRYIVDEQLNLMDTYLTFSEMRRLGFRDASVKWFVLNDPADVELLQSIRIYGLSADSYFDSYESLTSNSYIMMEQIIKILNNYPNKRVEIAVHTDNSATSANNLRVSQRRAEMMTSYLIRRGINQNQLTAKGLGDTRPVAANSTETGRKQNRRVEFIITEK